MERTKLDRKSPVISAAEMTAQTRSAAKDWVAREERRTGSRMTAYEVVAQTVGASPSWLRKFISGHDEAKQPNWTVGWNILAAYRRACEKFEQRADAERTATRALERQIDAIVTSSAGLVERAPPAEKSGADTKERRS